MTKRGGASFFLIFVIGVGLFSSFVGTYFVPLQIGAVIDGLGLTATQSGLLGAVEIAAMSLTAILIAPKLADWSLRRVAIGGALLAAACEIFTAPVETFSLLLPLRSLVGVGCGCIFGAVCATAASSNSPDRTFAWGQAVMNSLFLVMFLILPYTLAFGVHRGLFVSLGILLLIATPLYRKLRTTGIPARAAETGQGGHLPIISLHILATALLNIGLGALWGFVERIGTVRLGLTIETVGTILSVATLFMIGGSAFAGWLGTRIGRIIPMVTAAMLCAGAAFSITHTNSPTVYFVGLMVYNAAYLFIGPYIIAGTASALDPSGRLASTFGGSMFFFYSVGVGAGGLMIDLVSLSAIGWLALIGCLAAAPLYAIVGHLIEVRTISAAE